MDQSGSRRESVRATQQSPLIIERPDLAHPLRRVFALLFTLLAWGLWVALWLPVLASLAAYCGLPLPWAAAFPEAVSLAALWSLVGVFPLAIGLVILVLAVNGLYHRINGRFSSVRKHRLVGMEQLATGMALDAEQLAHWQSARILHVEHGPRGRVIDARIVR